MAGVLAGKKGFEACCIERIASVEGWEINYSAIGNLRGMCFGHNAHSVPAYNKS